MLTLPTAHTGLARGQCHAEWNPGLPPTARPLLPAGAHVARSFQTPTDAYHPIITNLTEERKSFQRPGVVLSYLHNLSRGLPSKSLSEDTARNLTEVSARMRLWGGPGWCSHTTASG